MQYYVYIVCFHISTVAPFVPREFTPEIVLRRYANTDVVLTCPFHHVGNPLPSCTWSRIDSNNITHEVPLSEPKVTSADNSPSYCQINYMITENDNGLYQCTGYNVIGNTTYTFPEPFIVESELL